MGDMGDMPRVPHSGRVRNVVDLAPMANTSTARKPITLYLSPDALARLDARTAAASDAAGVPIPRALLAAALVHRALGLAPDGSALPEGAPAGSPAPSPPPPPEPSQLPEAPPVEPAAPAAEDEHEEDEHEEDDAAAAPPAPPAKRGRVARPETPDAVIATFRTLARVTDREERRRVVRGYVSELAARCGLSETGARSLLGAKGNRRKLRIAAADFEG